jgi:hypothetical protein
MENQATSQAGWSLPPLNSGSLLPGKGKPPRFFPLSSIVQEGYAVYHEVREADFFHERPVRVERFLLFF